MGDVFDARDLWATQVPYAEHDKVEPVTVTNVRTVLFAAHWRTASNLAIAGFALPTDGELSGAGKLSADGAVA